MTTIQTSSTNVPSSETTAGPTAEFAFDAGSLAAMVNADPGSVTSRVLLRTGGAVLTVFAFAEGQGLTEHATPHDALLQVLEGGVRVSVGDRDFDLKAGEILHLPRSIPHTLHEGGAFKMALFLMKAAA